MQYSLFQSEKACKTLLIYINVYIICMSLKAKPNIDISGEKYSYSFTLTSHLDLVSHK